MPWAAPFWDENEDKNGDQGQGVDQGGAQALSIGSPTHPALGMLFGGGVYDSLAAALCEALTGGDSDDEYD